MNKKVKTWLMIFKNRKTKEYAVQIFQNINQENFFNKLVTDAQKRGLEINCEASENLSLKYSVAYPNYTEIEFDIFEKQYLQ